jgi:hypothetical protein
LLLLLLLASHLMLGLLLLLSRLLLPLTLLGCRTRWLMCCVAYVAACLVWAPDLYNVVSSDCQVAAARVGCEHRHVLHQQHAARSQLLLLLQGAAVYCCSHYA